MENRVVEAFIKQKKECQNPEIQDAINEQVRLSIVVKGKRDSFDRLKDQSLEYLRIGMKKLSEKFPQFEEDLPKEDIKMDIAMHALSLAINNPSKFKEIVKNMKEIEELNKNDELDKSLTQAFFEYVRAFSEFEDRLKKDRKNLFSKEYKKRMEELADDGVLLYFLETPDLPLIDSIVTSNDILDSLIEGGIENLLRAFFEMRMVGPSMRKKQEDLGMVLWLAEKDAYRCAARTLFALIESEHIKASKAYEGIINKKRQYWKSVERAQKIDKLVDSIEDGWLKIAWKKTDQYYTKVWAKKPYEGVIHRNTIVHGDYDNQIMEIDKYSVYKLLLLWLNLRLIADNFYLKAEILENILLYLPSIIIQAKKDKKDRIFSRS